MAREFGRSARVSSQIQKELALIIQREMKDPRIGLVTVNEVVVTKDLAVAKVYITFLNAEQQAISDYLKIINDAAAYLRGEVGKRMKMRSIPELRFFYDDSMDTGLRMDALLKGLDVESDSDIESED